MVTGGPRGGLCTAKAHVRACVRSAGRPGDPSCPAPVGSAGDASAGSFAAVAQGADGQPPGFPWRSRAPSSSDRVARYPLAWPVTRPQPAAREGAGVAPTCIWQEVHVERARRGQRVSTPLFKIQVLLNLGLARPSGQEIIAAGKTVRVQGSLGNGRTPRPTGPRRDRPGSGRGGQTGGGLCGGFRRRGREQQVAAG